MPFTGERPGKGTYKCSNCGQKIMLDDNSNTLTPCTRCRGNKYEKVEKIKFRAIDSTSNRSIISKE